MLIPKIPNDIAALVHDKTLELADEADRRELIGDERTEWFDKTMREWIKKYFGDICADAYRTNPERVPLPL